MKIIVTVTVDCDDFAASDDTDRIIDTAGEAAEDAVCTELFALPVGFSSMWNTKVEL